MRAMLSNPLPAELTGPYAAPRCVVRGDARGDLFSSPDYSLWRIVGEMAAGAEIEWAADHGDEALYVVDGEVDLDGTIAGAGSAVVVEAGVRATVRATKHTRVVHVGPQSVDPPRDGLRGPAREDGHRAHVVPIDEIQRNSSPGSPVEAQFFTDGTCPTCRIALFIVDGTNALDGYTAVSHTHSEDEIIHVLSGVMHVGPLRVEPGMSIAVPRELRYGFRTEGPFRFLNYRRDVALYTALPGSEPVLEVVSKLRSAQHAVD
jgi:quercetin dioxygenase-like cupin family protein